MKTIFKNYHNIIDKFNSNILVKHYYDTYSKKDRDFYYKLYDNLYTYALKHYINRKLLLKLLK